MIDRGKLRELRFYVRRCVKQESRIRCAQHGRVIERIARCNDAVIELLERKDSSALLIRNAQPVIHNAVIPDQQCMAEQGGHTQLTHEGRSELFEGVRQDQQLGCRAQGIQKIPCARQRFQGANHGLYRRQAQPVLVKYLETTAHQLVVIGFVARCPAQGFDAGFLGNGNPDFRCQHTFHVEGDDRLFHIAGFFKNQIGEQTNQTNSIPSQAFRIICYLNNNGEACE